MSSPSFSTWASADAFLRKGRNEDYRRAGSNRYAARQADGSISLVLYSTAIVTYHQDGTFTLFHGGYRTRETQRRISEYSPFRVGSSYDRKHPGWQLGWTGERTPSRRWKCRTCSGTGGTVHRKECQGGRRWDLPQCEGMKTKYTLEFGNGVSWDEHCASRYTEPCEHGPQFTRSHYLTLCEHGSRRPHHYGEIFESACYRCDGEGIAEYGDQPIPMIWPGTNAVRMAADSTVLDLDAPRPYAPGKPYKHKPYKAQPYQPYDSTPAPTTPEHKPKNVLGSEATTVLEAAIPAMRTTVKCPHCKDMGSSHTETITSMVIHLNDTIRWTREQIADWLDTLDADLRFPTPKDVAA